MTNDVISEAVKLYKEAGRLFRENRRIAKEAQRHFQEASADEQRTERTAAWMETAAQNSAEMQRLLKRIISLGEEHEEVRRHKVYALAHRNLGLYSSRRFKSSQEIFPSYMEESVNYLKTALSLGIERDKKVTRRLGAAYYQSGKFKEAVEPLLESIEADPDDEVARYHLCLTYLSLHEIEKAKEQYEALKQKPDSIHYHLAMILEPMMDRPATRLDDAEREELERMIKNYRRVKE